MRFYLTGLCTLTLALALPCFAFTQSPRVYLNEVDITGMRGQDFQNVNVSFDNAGNLNIIAPQYKVKETTKQAPLPTPALASQPDATSLELLSTVASQSSTIPSLPNSTQATHLEAIFDSPGLFGFNIDLYVNGHFIKSLDQGNAQSSIDISSHLVKGNNKIQYRLVASADSGKSSRATVELFLAKQTSSQGNAIELSGNYAPLMIKSESAKGIYEIDIVAP